MSERINCKCCGGLDVFNTKENYHVVCKTCSNPKCCTKLLKSINKKVCECNDDASVKNKCGFYSKCYGCNEEIVCFVEPHYSIYNKVFCSKTCCMAYSCSREEETDEESIFFMPIIFGNESSPFKIGHITSRFGFKEAFNNNSTFLIKDICYTHEFVNHNTKEPEEEENNGIKICLISLILKYILYYEDVAVDISKYIKCNLHSVIEEGCAKHYFKDLLIAFLKNKKTLFRNVDDEMFSFLTNNDSSYSWIDEINNLEDALDILKTAFGFAENGTVINYILNKLDRKFPKNPIREQNRIQMKKLLLYACDNGNYYGIKFFQDNTSFIENLSKNEKLDLLKRVCFYGGEYDTVYYLFDLLLDQKNIDIGVYLYYFIVGSAEYGHFKISHYLIHKYIPIVSYDDFTMAHLCTKIVENIRKGSSQGTPASVSGIGLRDIPSAETHRFFKKQKLTGIDQDEYYSIVKYNSFFTYKHEIEVENGSDDFDRIRKQMLSASKNADVCGVSKYCTPKQKALDFYKKFPMNDHTERGVINEQFVRQILFMKTGWRMPMRKCGIFKIPYTRFSAMPDDIAYISKWKQEIIIEYKNPVFYKKHPYLGYIFQTNWQMGIVGLKHAFLVDYAMDCNEEGGDERFRVWHVEFSEELFIFQLKCCLEFSKYLDFPCDEMLPCTPHIYYELAGHQEKGTWVPGHVLPRMPPAPKIKQMFSSDLKQLLD